MKPLDAVRVTADCLERGEAVPPMAANVVARALRQYLNGESDITKNLGLRPGRRGRYESPLQLERIAKRNDSIRQLYERQEGNKTVRASKVADLLRAPHPSGRVADDEVCEYLRREFEGGLPTSARQVLRVVDGETLESRRR